MAVLCIELYLFFFTPQKTRMTEKRPYLVLILCWTKLTGSIGSWLETNQSWNPFFSKSLNLASVKWQKWPLQPHRPRPPVAIFMSISGFNNWLRNIAEIAAIHLRNWAKLSKKSWLPDVNLWPLIRKGQQIPWQVLVQKLLDVALVSTVTENEYCSPSKYKYYAQCQFLRNTFIRKI